MSCEPSADGIPELVADLFRVQAGRMTARLARLTGSLDTAEELVQTALLKALQLWPFQGVPANPAGWLWQAARNAALDGLRRNRFQAPVTPGEIADALSMEAADDPCFARELEDDRLRLVFACCHPVLSAEAQIALALRTVCGLGTAEVARTFLLPEPTLAQRLVRAKAALAKAQVPFAIPGPEEIPARLPPVLGTLYLMFNSGYEALEGDRLIRAAVAMEAVRLACLAAEHPAIARPATHALAALLCLLAARLPARTGPDGLLVPLDRQDRGAWDPHLTARGFRHLARSMQGGEETRWHVEAAIAATHAAATTWSETDWNRIVTLYDRLMRHHPSPLVALNRAVALAEAAGPVEGLAALAGLEADPRLARYPLYHATLAELCRRADRPQEARAHLRSALALAISEPSRRLLEERLSAV